MYENTMKESDCARELEVHKWLGELRNETDHALKAVLELRERLNAVTRPKPESVGKEDSPQPMLVPLADTLRALCYTAKETASAAKDVISRLEV